MSEAYVEALREKRRKLHSEAEGIRPVVERAKAEFQEAAEALRRAIARVDECDREIQQAVGS